MMSEMFGAFRDAREKWGTAFTDDVSEQMNRQGERSAEEVGWKWVEENAPGFVLNTVVSLCFLDQLVLVRQWMKLISDSATQLQL